MSEREYFCNCGYVPSGIGDFSDHISRNGKDLTLYWRFVNWIKRYAHFEVIKL